MDELVHHCLRELSFDGDLGCDVSRLQGFIEDFYVHNPPWRTQVVDDAYRSFVWSVIVQQPQIQVGIVPSDTGAEVYVALQSSGKRKSKGQRVAKPTGSTALDTIPDAKSSSLTELIVKYGDNLRLSVDSETSFAAITGSHIRPAKLSPMVYSALQLVTRGREEGISVIDLGKKTGYDQKTCFYLIKQLLDLDLVVKLRKGGVSTNFCIHKYFFDRSPSWKQIREEEARARAKSHQLLEPEDDDRPQELTDDISATATHKELYFEPIDARHLSSLELVRARVVKLLQYSKNNMHAAQNLLVTIGFSNPTKTDRRFFNVRVRELIDQGVIEKVLVRKRDSKSEVMCVCLVSAGENTSSDPKGLVVAPPGAANDDSGTIKDGDTDDDQSGLKMNATFHKQLIDLLAEAGTKGLTLNELSDRLSHFDKRTIELLLSRMEKHASPPHLSDIGVVGLMETHGREHRHRYFTASSYQGLLEQEKLEDSGQHEDLDLSLAGGFMSFQPCEFHTNEVTLMKCQDGLSHKEIGPEGSVKRIPKVYKGKPRKNPVLPDGTVKRGRPRTRPEKSTTVDMVYQADLNQDLVVSAAGVRPRKKRKRDRDGNGEDDARDDHDDNVREGTHMLKKRGRPSKKIKIDDQTGSSPSRTRGWLPKQNMVASSSKLNPGDSVPTVFDEGTSLNAGEVNGRSQSSQSHTDRASQEWRDESSVANRRDALNANSDAQQQDNHSLPLEDRPAIDVFSGPASEAESEEQSIVTKELKTQRVSRKRNALQSDFTFSRLEGRLAKRAKVLTRISSSEAMANIHATEPIIPAHAHVSSGVVQPPASVGSSISLQVVSCSEGDVDVGLAGSSSKNAEVESNPLVSPGASPSLPDDRDGGFLLVQDLGRSVLPDKLVRSKANVSHMRRENELFKVIERFGGIANVLVKEFLDGHMTVIETLVNAGEPASAPIGTRLDRRTADAALKNLELRGRIKLLTTSFPTPTGATRSARLAYLPTIDQGKMNEFLADLARNTVCNVQPTVKRMDDPVPYGTDYNLPQRRALPLELLRLDRPEGGKHERWARNIARADQLAGYDQDTVRQVLLTENHTLSQLYGFIVGRAMRARELHLFTLKHFESDVLSSHVVSAEKRIVDLSYYSTDLPVSTYCSIVSALVYEEALERLLETEGGQRTQVKDLPPNLHASLQVGRSRGRARILDMMEMLRSLGLVIPLVPTDSSTPWISCQPNGDHPDAFDIVTANNWSVSTAPIYWYFTSRTSIFLWALSDVTPPFWKETPVLTSSDGVSYWNELKLACLNRELALNIVVPMSNGSAGSYVCSKSVAVTLRREGAWNPFYVLSWHQSQYLRRFVDTMASSGSEEDLADHSLLQSLARVVCAPSSVVLVFLNAERSRRSKAADRAQNRKKKKRAEDQVEKDKEAKALFAQKAAEAKLQRERDWEELLHRLHPEPWGSVATTRVQRLRTRFLQSGGKRDVQKWEKELNNAILESKRAVETVFRTAVRRPLAKVFPAIPLPAVVVNASEKSVESLIAQQGNPIVPRISKPKKKAVKSEEGSEVEVKTINRRHRFQWNRDFDELAKDASVIIKSRCRNSRMDWSALDQVFPAVPRNSVRQHIGTLLEEPGGDTYLKRLEDTWHSLWLQHRGTTALPDEEHDSTSRFSLASHIAFLRKHVDKNAIRVGMIQSENQSRINLPFNVHLLSADWEVVEKPSFAPTWDFMWTLAVDEAREKHLLRDPFVLTIPSHVTTSNPPPDRIRVVESALKMVLGTPNEHYDPELGTRILQTLGSEVVSVVNKDLLNRGVLSKLVRDPNKPKPGRTVKISEMNQNALGGSLPRDIFLDASALDDLFVQQEGVWRGWPLLSTDGDTAALIQLGSEKKVSFKIDTAQVQSVRPLIDWNSKKACDDHIETNIYVCFHGVTDVDQYPNRDTSSEPSPTAISVELDGGHGKTLQGDAACCQTASDGIVDCRVCLDAAFSTFATQLSDKEMALTRRLLTIISDAGPQGVTKDTLRAIIKHPDTDDIVWQLVERMTDTRAPLLFWGGYSSTVLVASTYLDAWALTISEGPVTKLLPRRWLNITGHRIDHVWDAALRAVIGVVLFRPGISQAELRWRLRSVYDRLELNDVLRFLSKEKILSRKSRPGANSHVCEINALDEQEELSTLWFLSTTGRRWYQV